MRQWGEGVIDRLDEAAVADGGGLVTALAALARTPARSFTSFMQGTAGTVSLLDGRVRGEISDGLSQVMSDPGLIGRAASDYWHSRTLADMAADLYANGAAGAMMGGAGAAALGRLNRLPGLEALADAVANAKPATARLRQTGAVGDLGGAAEIPKPSANITNRIPLAFSDARDLAQFNTRLQTGLREAGYRDVQPIIQGSSVTGESFRTGAPFDVMRRSDLDVALASRTLMQRARELGIPLRGRGTRTMPLTNEQMRQIGFYRIAENLSRQYRRLVAFMIYDSVDVATSRSPSVVLPRK